MNSNLRIGGWNPNHKREKFKSSNQFVETVNAQFQEFDYPEASEYVDSEEITRAVLKVIATHVSAGEIKDIVACLPEDLRELWS